MEGDSVRVPCRVRTILKIVTPHTFIYVYSYFSMIWYLKKIRVIFFIQFLYKSLEISTEILVESPLYQEVSSYRPMTYLHFKYLISHNSLTT